MKRIAFTAAAAALAFGATELPAHATTTARFCGVGDLAASLRAGSPGAGQRYATLSLKNRSTSTCRTRGYVGMQFRTSAGDPVSTKVSRDGSAGAPFTITLKPGQSTKAQLHWGAVEGTGDNGNGPCVHAPARVDITPPDARSSIRIPWKLGIVCEQGSIDVRPLGR